MKLIKLTEPETVRLMKLSTNRALALSFGANEVFLRTDESPWAVELLVEWRGRDPEGL